MRVFQILFLWFVFAGATRADELSEAIAKITDVPAYKSARWGLLVVDAKTGKTVYEREPDKLFTPASTTKLYTCATALAELGPDHRFRTPVYQHGTVKDGVLTGDLILVASGDPTMGGRRGKDGKTLFEDNDHTYAGGTSATTLTDSDPTYALDQLAKQIRKNGITEVTGGVFVDDGLFPKARSSGSGPELVSPIVINDNVVDVQVLPAKTDGMPATIVTRPVTEWIQIDAKVKTGPSDGRAAISVLSTPNRIVVRGTIPAMSPTITRIAPVASPDLFARALFIEALVKNGVKVRASLKDAGAHVPPTSAYDKLPKVAEYQSEPLSDVIKVILKVSHNLYASTLPILVGVKHQQGTIQRGLEQQAKFLKGLGIDPATVSFAGGAGGANADAVTPRTTVQLIQAMAKHKSADVYFDALPVIGVDGTLASVVPKDSPVLGKCRAKTGTLMWSDLQNDRTLMRSKALAGELTTAKGTKLYFAMFLNDVPLAPGGTTTEQGKVLGKVAEAICVYGP